MQPFLYYVHDPMCSWCWGFRPVLEQIKAALAGRVECVGLLGGLAPDTDQPMPEAMRNYLHNAWRSIQQRIPGTEFNFDFWSQCQPRRATYPACRAVIAAKEQGAEFELPMILAIQQAYYLEARNPSDEQTLIDLANSIGLDAARFARFLNSDNCQQKLAEEIALSRQLGADSFPTLLLVQDAGVTHIRHDYNSPQPVLDQVNALLDS